MTHTFLRYAVSIFLGTAIALSLVGASQLIHVQSVHAQDNELTAEDLLGEDFRGATGLGQADLETTIGNIINVVLGFLGIVAVVIVLLGGFKWMTAGGNDDKVMEARRLLIAGVIGLAIVISAYAITSFAISSLIQSTSA